MEKNKRLEERSSELIRIIDDERKRFSRDEEVYKEQVKLLLWVINMVSVP